MRVLVVGPGAVGILIGVMLGNCGHEVTFFCRQGTEEAYPQDFQILGLGNPQTLSRVHIRSAGTFEQKRPLTTQSYFASKASRQERPLLIFWFRG